MKNSLAIVNTDMFLPLLTQRIQTEKYLVIFFLSKSIDI